MIYTEKLSYLKIQIVLEESDKSHKILLSNKQIIKYSE